MLALVLLIVLLLPSPAAATSWRPPVRGPVVASFSWSAAHPYAGGQRRGLRLESRRGERVVAACSGRVTFAGTTPRGRAVSVRCGGLTATHLPLAAVAVRRGALVASGAAIGTAAGTTLHLGARRGRGYVDPAPLLRAPAPDLGPAPPPAAVRRRGAPPTRVRSPDPVRAAEPVRRGPPLLARLAIGALAAATGAGGLVRRRRGADARPRATRVAVDSLSSRP